ncbi:MAG: carbamoyl-phosphate synthase large subunit, partial [Vampirovibrionales bacterium]
MPKRSDIQKILILGAGPIVIGQACEFDYSGTQACRALMEEGYEVILVNSNPATIMTDPDIATKTYIEPLTVEYVTRVIEQERPDALLPTMGGQTALNLAIALQEAGVLEAYNVQMIGASLQAIEVAEDRDKFRSLVESIGLEQLRSRAVHSMAEAEAFIKEIGFPFILRSAFTLGGSGGAVVYSASEMADKVGLALALSPIHQVLMEESALRWKEYEYEVMRDKADNVVIVCAVENLDPMGVHTGDSITVAPAQTLTDKEYQHLRNASIRIIRAVGVEAGGCNIQFAIHPTTGRVVVIEMKPRVSRSSALVSKATGVPIAKVSAKLAVGYTLDEISNDITQTTPACFEPSIDYVVTKIPRFSFEKFQGASTVLSPQMKSVGEVMAIGATFQESFQKALRGLEIGLHGFFFPSVLEEDEAVLLEAMIMPTPERLHQLYSLLKRGTSIERLYDTTGIDRWFLSNMASLVAFETTLRAYTLETLTSQHFALAKAKGFSDVQLALILGTSQEAVRHHREALGVTGVIKAVDTCAAEFDAKTPYFYSTYFGNESELTQTLVQETTQARKLEGVTSQGQSVVILGGGPNRIGQGLEFDYCCVHAALTLKQLGYDAVMVNSNPETVSTDYDISDRLYFDPLTGEDVANLLHKEQALQGQEGQSRLRGVILQLGGQTPLKLAHSIQTGGFPVLGTTVDDIDCAEDRERFRQLLNTLQLQCPASATAFSVEQALQIARTIGFPLILRPSYVLGGRAMRVVYSEASLLNYLQEVVNVEPDHPVLIERFLEQALELDVDAISDGEETLVAGIMEHIEHAGVHSGDSTCVWPAQNVSQSMEEQVVEATKALAKALRVKGLLNIQFAIQEDTLYVLEVNPRASRTVPFIGKATGWPLVRMAVECMLGASLPALKARYQPKARGIVAVKGPVFPFLKFRESDPKLGPEMKSTGEVMGIDTSFPVAYAKALMGANVTIPTQGRVFFSISDKDKTPLALDTIRWFLALGFDIACTEGTGEFLKQHGIMPAVTFLKKHQAEAQGVATSAESAILSGDIHLVINTPRGEGALADDSYLRKAAIAKNIPMVTTMTAAYCMAQAVAAVKS